MKKKIVLSAVTIFSFFYFISTFNSCQPPEKKEEIISVVNDSSLFIGDKACNSCHVKEYADWKISDHFHAMLPATDSSVKGDFNNATFTADGVTSRFFKRGDQFILNTQGNDGVNRDFLVKYTFGHYPLQQYLVEFPGGRMQVSRQCWDTKNKKWFQQYAGQKIAPNDWLHWTNRGQNWNASCASCHSTNLQVNYMAEADSFHTTWSSVNVSCESCHGAGKKHAEYILSADFKNGKKTTGSHLSFHSNQSSLEQLNTCAPCHSRRFSIDDAVAVTDDLLNHYIPESPHQPAYHADGQILEEDYEYGSFLQSKMFQHNVKCSSCHNPHSGKLVLTGNNLCTSCHSKSLDAPAHTLHTMNSEGSLCVNCHAPGKLYMGNDFRRDHSFGIPRPDLTIKYGTPNACNNCHSDRNAKWAAEEIIKKFGPKRKYHFSEDLVPASLGMFSSSKYLQKFSSPDTTIPAVIRASAMFYASYSPDPGSVTIILKGLKDSSALVRYESLKSLKAHPMEAWKTRASGLLKDPVTAVRIAAADLFLPYTDSLKGEGRNYFLKAKKELFDFLQRNSSQPQGMLMLADAEYRMKDYPQAERDYLQALRMDSLLIPARLSLSIMYDGIGEKEKALKQLKIAHGISPVNEEVNYYLALLYVELKDFKKATDFFSQSVTTTKNQKVFYNFGLLLEQLKEDKKAENIYLKGLKLNAENIDLNYVLALYYYNHERKPEAIKYLKKLTELSPENAQFRAMFNHLNSQLN